MLRYRPMTPSRITPITSGNANTAPGAKLACFRSEPGPAAAGLVIAQVAGQDRRVGGQHVVARSQLDLGELLAAVTHGPPI